MSFQNCTADIDGTAFTDDSGRPCFTSIARNTAFSDKKLAASGHARRNQEDIAKEGDYDTDDDDSEAELVKRLNNVRQRAVTAVHGGQKTFVSRNTYKDKGGKSSQNSKIQKQLGGL